MYDLQVAYPRRATDADRQPATELLERVGLGPVLEAHSLDDVKDWHSVLSGGQKQRLAWSRMLHANSQFAFIDEGTSAISKDVIDTLCVVVLINPLFLPIRCCLFSSVQLLYST